MSKEMEQAFIRAYEEHADALFRYCSFKIHDRELAKDLLQEAFSKTWAYLAKGEEVGNLRAFLYRTLGNLIIDEYRKKKTSSLDALMDEGFDRSEDEPLSVEDRIDAASAMELLKKLPEGYGDVIFMKYVQELSLKEIAEITRQSENAVAVRIHRGLQKARKLFNH